MPITTLKLIQPFGELTIDGTCYAWNEEMKAYVSAGDRARTLLQEDVAILKLNGMPIAAAEPTTIGFTFKSITDREFTARTQEEHTVFLEELGESLGVENWSGELHWQCGDSSGKAQLGHL